jgi:hypothetical protein
MDKKDREMTGKKNECCKAEVRPIGKLQQIGCYGASNTRKAEMDTLIPVSMRGQPLLKFRAAQFADNDSFGCFYL